jgi:hypothetical protein
LAFIARRVQSDPIVLLAAVREGYPSPLLDVGLPEYRLVGLASAAAEELLDSSAPRLAASVRERLLDDAGGNPLALIELPISAGDVALVGADSLALTDRLERAFAFRVSELPDETRRLLEVVALSEEGIVPEVIAAASAIAGDTVELEALEPAIGAAIAVVNGDEVRFRHPLIRSAVRQQVGLAESRRIHRALAEVLRDDADRRVWHRAALITGVHEDIARELEEAAARARRRGALAVAVTALQRSAELSEPDQRVGRLLSGAEIAFELGQGETVEEMLAAVGQLRPDPLQSARAAWIEEVSLTQPLADPDRVNALLSAAEHARDSGDRDLQLDLLWLLASRAWWVEPPPATRQALVKATKNLGDPRSAEPRVLAIQAYADPSGNEQAVLDRVRAAAANFSQDTDAARFFGPAAVVVGAFDVALTLLGAAVEGLRTEGRLGHLPRLLLLQGSMAARVANWDVAIPSAEECRRSTRSSPARAETKKPPSARQPRQSAWPFQRARTSRWRLPRRAVCSRRWGREDTQMPTRPRSACSTL